MHCGSGIKKIKKKNTITKIRRYKQANEPSNRHIENKIASAGMRNCKNNHIMIKGYNFVEP